MHCGGVPIDCRRCLCAKVSSLFVEIQRGDVVFTAYACEHGAVLNPFGCVVSHTFDCSPCFLRNNAALRWPTEGNHRDRHWRGGLESMALSGIERGMEKGNTLPARISTALLLLRIASAMAFLYHGSAILFGSFGGPGPQQFAASHHWPVVMGYLIGLAQFAGGLAVLTGILFRLGAACIAVVMLGAIFLVHLPNGFDIGKGGAEYALTQLLLAVAFLLAGPGSYSLAFWLPAPLRKF